ncbi:mitochondrial pyruvate carrier 2-like isoform X1 [Hydractinia symbiolongicarpus]|uniref:mitochondrial pyruvate carrier 2-like isoform X1 n=1 Tax=Hydractinia symbiolongicarpus TaxID=13093 RepID=UPI00254C97EE|nr:mitochondrial pyruvate carrier 2-like isoform X1 [Hydractinia symbiolongicarpus]
MAAARFLLQIEKRLPQKLIPMWNHPAGLKTIHFWAPAFKWGLVIAGISDTYRPPEKLSFSQSSALGATGMIFFLYKVTVFVIYCHGCPVLHQECYGLDIQQLLLLKIGICLVLMFFWQVSVSCNAREF